MHINSTCKSTWMTYEQFRATYFPQFGRNKQQQKMIDLSFPTIDLSSCDVVLACLVIISIKKNLIYFLLVFFDFLKLGNA